MKATLAIAAAVPALLVARSTSWWDSPNPSLSEFPNTKVVHITAQPGADLAALINGYITTLGGEPAKIILPRGTLDILSPINLTDGVELIGAGAMEIAESKDSGESFTLLNYKPLQQDSDRYAIRGIDVRNCAVRNMTILGDAEVDKLVPDLAEGGILFRDSFECVVESVHFQAFYRGRFEDHSAFQQTGLNLTSVASAIQLDNSKQCLITNCSINGCNIGVSLSDGSSNNRFSNCFLTGLTTCSAAIRDSENNYFTNNILDNGVVSAHWELEASSGNLFYGNRLEGNQPFGPTQNAAHCLIDHLTEPASSGNLVAGNQSVDTATTLTLLHNAKYVFGLAGTHGTETSRPLHQLGSSTLLNSSGESEFRFSLPERWNRSSSILLRMQFAPLSAQYDGQVVSFDLAANGYRRAMTPTTASADDIGPFTLDQQVKNYTATFTVPMNDLSFSGDTAESVSLRLTRTDASGVAVSVDSASLIYDETAFPFEHDLSK